MGEVIGLLALASGMAAWSVRLAAALIFLEAAVHALRDRDVFAGIVAAYRIVPAAAAGPAALAVPALQIIAALLLVIPLFAPAGTILSLGLVLVFTASMAVNLRRGRRDIDCGCGGGRAQKISTALVSRNLVVAALLAGALAAPNRVSADGASIIGIAGFAVFLVAVYFAANQLIGNAQAFAPAKGLAA